MAKFVLVLCWFSTRYTLLRPTAGIWRTPKVVAPGRKHESLFFRIDRARSDDGLREEVLGPTRA